MLLNLSFLSQKLPNFFNLQLWILIVISLALSFMLLTTLFLYLRFISYKRKKFHAPHFCIENPGVSGSAAMERSLLCGATDLERNDSEVGFSTRSVGLDYGLGKMHSFEEIEEATNGFSVKNVIDSGGYWVVYLGMLDNKQVAVKDLVIESENLEEFLEEMERIKHATHKNLVKLIGYCIEEDHRMLVYDYTDNGDLDQWLHAYAGPVSPLTWGIRMKIIMGIAKGLAYLHEDLEPEVIHGDIKSSNILLDQQWNPRIFGFGFANLIGDEENQNSQEYASTGNLMDKSDVYSFGVLIMEIISGRTAIDCRQPQLEVCLVEWVKSMISDWKLDFVVDSKLSELPDLIELKRILLIALRCVDPEAKRRPKMGDVIHMLEPRDLLLIEIDQIEDQMQTQTYLDHLQENEDNSSNLSLQSSDT